MHIYASFVPRPIPSFSMLHTEKREGLVSEVQSYNNHSIVSKPYIKLTVNDNALNFADLWLAHVHFHPSTTLYTDKIGHVTSDTRPSHFSACNIEKLGMGLGMRLYLCSRIHFCLMCRYFGPWAVCSSYLWSVAEHKVTSAALSPATMCSKVK